MSNLTVQGKVEYWCKSCQNCHTIKKTDSGMEYICSDPYDGMEKTLNGDSNITCSMYEARPNPTHVCYEQEVKVVNPGEKVDIPEPWWKDKEACTKISLEMDRLRREIHQLEKEKVAHMKGIERLKESNNDLKGAYNHLLETLKRENEAGSKIVEENVKFEKEKAELIKASKRKDELIQDYREKLKRAEGLLLNANKDVTESNENLKKAVESRNKLREYYRTDEKLIDNIQKVIFPQEEGSDYTYSYEEILNKVKDLKVQSDENGTMYEDLKYWKERCHKAETDVTTLNSKVEVLDKRNTNQFVMIGEKDKEIESLKNKIVTQQSTHYKQCSRILELENMVSKLQSGEYDDILAKDIEIKSLQAKYEDAMTGWKDIIDTNDKLNQTISDLTESNEILKKMVERRDKWVEELKSDVDTLQNECLAISEIAKRAYDETNRD